jgi:hypothetical protein
MEEESNSFISTQKDRYFLDPIGSLIAFLVDKPNHPYVSPSLKEIASKLKKSNNEFKLLIKKIKSQIKSDNPNWGLLLILKNKLKNMVNNYQKE